KLHKILLVILIAGIISLNYFVLITPEYEQYSTNVGLISIIVTLLIILLITFKKIIKQDLKTKQELSISQSSAKIGSWNWDIKNKTIYFSDTALKLIDVDVKKQIMSNAEFFSLIYKPDRKAHLKELKSAMNERNAYQAEIRCDTKRPFKRRLLSKGEVFFDEHSQPYKMIGMHQDITERVIQREMQESMEKILQSVIEHENLQSILTKMCSAVHQVEPSIYCVIYLSKDDELNERKFTLHHDDKLPKTLVHILNSVTLEDTKSEMLQTVNRTGPLHIDKLDQKSTWISANKMLEPLHISAYCGQSIIDSNQHCEAVICLYIQDRAMPIGLIKQILAMATRITAVAIEGQHQSDNQQKIQQQLYQSQKMESIGQLTAGIAHDFNNILGSIVGYTSLAQRLESAKNDDKLGRFLNEVITASRRARDLISQMMIFSRSEPSKNISVDAGLIIKDVLQLVKSIIPSSINITHHFEENINNISINPVALHQLIMNLFINAKDAMANNLGNIVINLYQVKRDSYECTSCHDLFSGEYVCIEVKDSGSGIPAKLINHIFDPFFTTKEIGQNTGMGLSVVHGILHDCGGHISVFSEPNSSTDFKLYFPAIKDDENSGLVEMVLPKNDSLTGNGEHIMVVDDDFSLSLLFEEIITSFGYKVSRFDNSQVALQAFLNTPEDYQLIISDQTMPFLPGDEMARQMLDVKPDLPVIICTGFSETLDENIANDIGIKTILSKPVTIKTLINWIGKTLK
ncbi:MAG: signal transduction histidine kinase/PAS domain-containing protein, partial [Enterobacterales bacterium]